jgi:hypothetical protein
MKQKDKKLPAMLYHIADKIKVLSCLRIGENMYSSTWPFLVFFLLVGAVGFPLVRHFAIKNAKRDHAEFIKPHDIWVSAHQEEIKRYPFSKWLADNRLPYPSDFGEMSWALSEYEKDVDKKFNR